MDFGRLSDLSGVDFTLPPDHADNARVLPGKPAQKVPTIFVGCPVWAQKEWVGIIYPKGTKAGDYLKHYSRQLNSIELNATHYRPPDSATVERWKKASPPGFRFCPKFPNLISHLSRLKNAATYTDEFCEALLALEDRMGMAFLQMPPNFTPQKFPDLEAYLRDFPRDIDIALELRHPQWFSDEQIRDRWFYLLEELGVTAVITDVSGRRDVLHQRLTTRKAFIRFTGNNLDVTDYSRADDWIERVGHWFEQGLEELYFFVHEPDKSLNLEMVGYVIQQFNKHLQANLKVPGLAHEAQQKPLF